MKALPASIPESTVANTGVCVRALILAKNRNSKPSLAMAYRIRGRGNMAPNKLHQKKNETLIIKMIHFEAL